NDGNMRTRQVQRQTVANHCSPGPCGCVTSTGKAKYRAICTMQGWGSRPLVQGLVPNVGVGCLVVDLAEWPANGARECVEWAREIETNRGNYAPRLLCPRSHRH